MKFGLLGKDWLTQPLVDAAVELGHEVVAPSSTAAEETYADDRWRDLLDPNFCDAVIIGAGQADSSVRGLQIQELVKYGQPILTTHPVCPSVLTYFEIDMARSESGALIEHYNPLTRCPWAQQFSNWIRDGHPQLGPIEQVVAQRTFADRSRQHVVWHFARDVQLLDFSAGPLDRIGALGAANDDTAYAALGVQLLGKPAVPVRWSVAPVEQSPTFSIGFVGAQGRAVATFEQAGLLREVRLIRGEDQTIEEVADYDPASAAIEEFAKQLQPLNQTTRTTGSSSESSSSSWRNALQAMELVDSIEISLRRGRMIDVHHQQLTEQLAFKGTMAAAGCGILLVLPPLLLLIGWVAELLRLPLALSRSWAYLLLGLLTLFLGLQLLPKLIYPRDEQVPDKQPEHNTVEPH